MCKICPRCGAIAEFNAYYGRVTCTRCNWESEKNRLTVQSKVYKQRRAPEVQIVKFVKARA